jgi:hypothetical protein
MENIQTALQTAWQSLGIEEINTNKTSDKVNVALWKKHLLFLSTYGLCMVETLDKRGGIADQHSAPVAYGMTQKLHNDWNEEFQALIQSCVDDNDQLTGPPPWVGLDKVHQMHRAYLVGLNRQYATIKQFNEEPSLFPLDYNTLARYGAVQ